MKARLFLPLVVVLAGSVSAASAQDRCLNYQPEAAKLRGTIVRRTFPGRPNYESIRHGDEPESYWILRLRVPVCIDSAVDYLPTERNVTDLQLVFMEGAAQYRRYRRFMGRKVTVSGTLFHQDTGHHHTKVLLTVKEIKRK
jgi:hypothetical protein